MNILGLFSNAVDGNMFHENSSSQTLQLPQPRLHAPWPARPRQHRAPFVLSHYARSAPPLALHSVLREFQLDPRPILPLAQATGAFR
jgi:hypothetical protein